MATIPAPHSKQLDVINSPQRYKVLAWGRRTGKSVLAGLVTFTEAMKHQGNYYIVAPTERQAKSIYWNDILRIVIPKELSDMCKINQVERTITFPHIKGEITLPSGETIYVEHDENRPPSTISLRGVDNPDALRGVKLAGCVLDEYAFMDNAKYVFDTIISPALGDSEGWAIFISSPNGVHNPFYDLVQTAQQNDEEYFFSHATALDNPFFPSREFERQRLRYASEGKLEAFTQEWEAEFKTPKLLIYKSFNRDIHVVRDREIDRSPLNTYAMGIDFGWIDPFAVVFCMIDQNNDWWVIDEIYQSELTTDKAHRLILDRMGDKNYSRIIGDAQAKTDIANFRERRFYINPSSKGSGSINEGIREVASYLELRETVRDGKKSDRPKLYVSDRCVNLIKEFESYSNRTDAYGEPIDTPEDKNNHLLDALRYLITDYMRARKPIQRRKRQYDPVTGRPLN